jgi:hypothetical protein
MGAPMPQAISLDDASSAPATDAFLAAFSWQPLSGEVIIVVEAGRMTSRFGERRVPKYGRFSACPRKV